MKFKLFAGLNGPIVEEMDDDLLTRSFENVKLILSNSTSLIGTISIMDLALTAAIYLVENTAETTNPFTDPYILNPLSNPYVSIGQHHLIDLSYYDDITIIESSQKICFHDPTREPAISLILADHDQFIEFSLFFHKRFTLRASELQGFYHIRRLKPPLFDEEIVSRKVAEFDSNPEKYKANSGTNCAINSQIVSQIAPTISQVTEMPEDKQSEAFQSREKMAELLQRYFLPNHLKADGWLFLTGLGTVENPNPDRMTEYLSLKSQWSSLTTAQMSRSKFLRMIIEKLTNSIESNSSILLTLCNGSKSILKVVFNVLMSITQLYTFLHERQNELIQLVEVFISMFVTDIQVVDNTVSYVTYHENITFSQDQLESLLFWSLVYLLEKGEIKRLFIESSTNIQLIVKPLTDFIKTIHPYLYYSLQIRDATNFELLMPMIILYFRTTMTCANCADLWIAAASTDDPFSFIQGMIISSLFFYFPNIWENKTKIEIIHIIQESFREINQYYLQVSSCILMKESKAILRSLL